MLRFEGIIRDPVHGDIPLTREELQVLDTAEMQRLRNVRQLGATHLIYPGAQHSRFEHSIGTAHLATRMVDAVNNVRDSQSDGRLDGYDAHGLRIIRLAALVHDATHLPFGHNIEDQTGLLPRHDTPARFEKMFSKDTDLGRALRKTGAHNDVLSILAPDLVSDHASAPPHWRGLVSGTIDADMLDYLARDAMFTGLKLEYDPRIFNVFRVDRRSQELFVDLGRKGYLKEAVLSEVVRCLEARFYFSERVYYHHAKIAAGSLVAKAVEIVLLEKAVTFEQLQSATDSSLFELLAGAKIKDARRRELLEVYLLAWSRRKLPKRAAVYPVYANPTVQQNLIDRFFGAGSAEERRATERRMTESLAKRVGREIPIMLYCPSGQMQLKQAKMLVRWPGDSHLTRLSDHSAEIPRLADLENSYTRMWKFYVHALTNDPQELAAAGEVCAEFFPEAENVLDRVRI
ncbi:MAG: HD domain-containing protein [Planctomycetes bacterium]|nr:HD domain-containing protein [Planctomycetota bacterium]MCP4769859.1 HD domain-containing protein [Planctomycetota bacterium]MCP4859699.1 HD domain-containing protein [Planctomycetota bacterium]